jgi:hypothetical protein
VNRRGLHAGDERAAGGATARVEHRSVEAKQRGVRVNIGREPHQETSFTVRVERARGAVLKDDRAGFDAAAELKTFPSAWSE